MTDVMVEALTQKYGLPDDQIPGQPELDDQVEEKQVNPCAKVSESLRRQPR
jgi:hypothetical protein